MSITSVILSKALNKTLACSSSITPNYLKFTSPKVEVNKKKKKKNNNIRRG
jgi:hypothetical protein